jgi:transcriptional regulator with XRE-family HTH domain
MSDDLIDRVTQARLEQDLTYEQLAAAVGLTKPAIWRILTKRTNPNERTRYRIERWLKSVSGKRREAVA